MSALAIPKPGSGFKNDRRGDPVRRGSRESQCVSDPSSWERAYRKVWSAADGAQLEKEARIYDDRTRTQGSRHGALGFRGRDLLEFMIRESRRMNGYLKEMSIRGYATMLKCSVQTIVNAMKALIRAGFLVKERRKTTLNEKGPSGYRKCVQDKNIYMVCRPSKAAAMWRYACGLRKQKRETQAQVAARLRTEADALEIARADVERRAPKLQPMPPHLAAVAKYAHIGRSDSSS